MDPKNFFDTCSEAFQSLIGTQVTKLRFAKWAVRIDFENEALLTLECKWLYGAIDGDMIDEAIQWSERTRFELWRIVGTRVSGFEYNNDPTPVFVMLLDNGTCLEVRSDTSGFQNWQLSTQHPNRTLVCSGAAS